MKKTMCWVLFTVIVLFFCSCAVLPVEEIELTFFSTPVNGLSVVVRNQEEVTPFVIKVPKDTTLRITANSPQLISSNSLIEGNDTRYEFLIWNDNNQSARRNIQASVATEIEAKFSKDFRVIFQKVDHQGITVLEDDWYDEPATSTFTAPDNQGSVFLYWRVDGEVMSDQNPRQTLQISVADASLIEAVYEQPLPSPVLLSPVNDARNILINPPPLLLWMASVHPSGEEVVYDVYFGLEGQEVLLKEGQRETHFQLIHILDPNKRYGWYVIARANHSLVAESTRWVFFTISSKPGEITHLEPEHASTSVSLTPTLRWECQGASSYDLYMGVAAPTHLYQEGLQESEYTVPENEALSPDTTYKWKVVARNALGERESAVWQFTTHKIPGIAHSPFPENQSVNIPLSVTLYWNPPLDGAGDETYDFYFGTEHQGAKPTASNLTVTEFRISHLEMNTRYIWYVVTRTASGVTTKGQLWYFSTGIGQSSPSKVRNPKPADGETIPVHDIVVQWNASDGSGTIEYDLYMGHSIEDMELHSSDLIDISLAIDTLQASKTYFWRVDSKNAFGTTEGPVWQFSTERPEIMLYLQKEDDYALTLRSTNYFELDPSLVIEFITYEIISEDLEVNPIAEDISSHGENRIRINYSQADLVLGAFSTENLVLVNISSHAPGRIMLNRVFNDTVEYVVYSEFIDLGENIQEEPEDPIP